MSADTDIPQEETPPRCGEDATIAVIIAIIGETPPRCGEDCFQHIFQTTY